jgi:hypothetical protein
MDDGYMGSGKYIRSAIAKHGIENFTKVILETFDTSEAMYAREKEVVTEEFLLREDVYNLRRGGFGGFEYINKYLDLTDRNTRNSRASRTKAAQTIKQLWETKWCDRDARSEDFILAARTSFKGKTHTEESRNKIGAANKGAGLGSNNSQYGTMWITNGAVNQKIRNDHEIKSGWIRGRTPPRISSINTDAG